MMRITITNSTITNNNTITNSRRTKYQRCPS